MRTQGLSDPISQGSWTAVSAKVHRTYVKVASGVKHVQDGAFRYHGRRRGTNVRTPWVAFVHDVGMPDANSAHTVLCVDDSEGHLKILELSLAAHSYQVELAQNGHEALTLLQSLTPDLMIVDVDMPFMDGFELAARVRRLRRFDGMPIVVMTAAERSDLRERAEAAGVDALLRKPVQGKNLAGLVTDLIRAGREADIERPRTAE